MYGLTRGLTTLIGAAMAGGLLWFAAWIGVHGSTSEYWAAMGAVAGAGLVLALSQLAGGWTKWGLPVVSPAVFLFAFVPTLIAGGWVVIAAQPNSNGARERILDWSSSIGISSLVTDLTTVIGAIAFGVGVVFGLVFDTTGPRYRDEELVEEEPPYADDRYADAPTTAERERVVERDGEYADTRREPVAVAADGRDERATPVAPQPAPEERPRRRSLFRR